MIARGLSESEAADLLKLSVQLALNARDEFWKGLSDQNRHLSPRHRPLVAASVGPYGAYLADGSEYKGDYDLDIAGLIEFHKKRWHLLANSGADFLMCETIPSHTEALAYLSLAKDTPKAKLAMAFTCPNGREISDGTSISEINKELLAEPSVIASRVNEVALGLDETLVPHVTLKQALRELEEEV